MATSASTTNRPPAPIDPTPTVGIVGLIRNAKDITPSHFQKEGDVIVLVGGPADGSFTDRNPDLGGIDDGRGGMDDGNDRPAKDSIGEELGASLYLREIHGLKRGAPPRLDLDREKKMHAAVIAAIRAGLVRSAHDLAEGGLLVALAECAIGGEARLGAGVVLVLPHERVDALLFGETQSRAILTVSRDRWGEFFDLFQRHGVPAHAIGSVGGDLLRVKIGHEHGPEWKWAVADLHRAWDESLAACLD